MTQTVRTLVFSCFTLLALVVLPATGWCAGEHLEGSISILWVIPFACMLLSIALGPLLFLHFWEHNYGKIAAFWGLVFLVPCAVTFGTGVALYEFVHIMVADYIPFIILLLALFTVAGGIRLKGSLVGSPVVNSTIFIIGTLLASWMGTTGAAMLLIRPLIRANAHRKYQMHNVVFFIFLVANIGGSLTPLGDPPLFLGFLKGVPFFWTFTHMMTPMLFISAILLVVHHILDRYYYNKEGRPTPPATEEKDGKLGLEGLVNFPLLGIVIAAVLMSGSWDSGINITVYSDITVALQNVARDVILLLTAFVSWKVTNKETRRLNDYSWEPIKEVAKIFFGIFVSMIPALAILKAGSDGALRDLIALVTSADGTPNDVMYFWLTGILSSFLDNAPTYVVFFSTAGGDPVALTTTLASTLTAISVGAVFMGANTYIGNAPNFMVRSIAENMGVKMPSFFGYMGWSIVFLIPCFILMTFIFF